MGVSVGGLWGWGDRDPAGVWPAPTVTLSSSRKMGTMINRMISKVWIMMMPSFSVFRRFSWAKVLNPGRRWCGRGEAWWDLSLLWAQTPQDLLLRGSPRCPGSQPPHTV